MCAINNTHHSREYQLLFLWFAFNLSLAIYFTTSTCTPNSYLCPRQLIFKPNFSADSTPLSDRSESGGHNKCQIPGKRFPGKTFGLEKSPHRTDQTISCMLTFHLPHQLPHVFCIIMIPRANPTCSVLVRQSKAQWKRWYTMVSLWSWLLMSLVCYTSETLTMPM